MKKPAKSDPKKRKGLIIVNTGDGKGKSTASFGLALRAAGNKMNVFIMQFMKGPWKAGERKALKKLSEYVEYEAMGDGFTWDTDNPEQDKKTAREAFDIAKEKLMSEKYQIIILDEINYVLEYKFFPLEEFLETLKNKPESVHVVCTGRNAHAKLIEIADLVTEMKLIKHPYDEQGIPAQKGIEF